jgi:hypothetical protein
MAVLWIRIWKDPNLLPDPQLEVSDLDPGPNMKLYVNINKNLQKKDSFCNFYHYNILNLSILRKVRFKMPQRPFKS